MTNHAPRPVSTPGDSAPLFGPIANAERLDEISTRLNEASTLIDLGHLHAGRKAVQQSGLALQEVVRSAQIVGDIPGDEVPLRTPHTVIVSRLFAAIQTLASTERLIGNDRATVLSRIREVQVQLADLIRIHRQENDRTVQAAIRNTAAGALTDCFQPCGLTAPVSVRLHTPRGQKPLVAMVGGYEAHESREEAVRAAALKLRHRAMNPRRHVTADRAWAAVQWSALGAVVVVAILSVLHEAGVL